jgi:hypothetical protein
MVEGNTKSSTISKQHTQRIYYCFTLFPDLEMIETIETRLSEICRKWIYGEEVCPTTSRKHLQGFMSLKKKMRLSELKIPGNPHIEPCLGSEEQNVKYCSKDKVIKSFGFPKPIETIKAEDFNTLQKKIYELFLAPVQKRHIYWFYDREGGAGKSDMCKYLYIHHKILFCNGGRCADLVNLVFNCDEVPAMIWDLPRDHSRLSYVAIEAIKNGMVCNTKYETGVKVFNPPHIFILSNSLPDDLDKLSKDRWVLYEVSDRGNIVESIALNK